MPCDVACMGEYALPDSVTWEVSCTHRWMQTVSSFIHEGVPLHEARSFLKVLDSSKFVSLVFLDPLAKLDCISFPFIPPLHRSPHAFPATFFQLPLTCRCRSITRYGVALSIAAKFDIAYVLQLFTCPLALCLPVRSFVCLFVWFDGDCLKGWVAIGSSDPTDCVNVETVGSSISF